jgi:hypothetical protein
VYPITSIHQIEITSRCNLRCRYCVHPKMPREKIDMTQPTFERCLVLARDLVRAGTQRELNLAGIGESTMHEQFVDFVQLARVMLGWKVDIVLATNGLLMTDELAEEMARYRMKVWVSMHRPEKAGPAVECLRRAGILAGVSADPTLAATDWAGQVKWHVSHPERMPCSWVSTGRAFVMADGRIATCCLDGMGEDGVLGTVFDDISTLRLKPYSLCESCSYEIQKPRDVVAA